MKPIRTEAQPHVIRLEQENESLRALVRELVAKLKQTDQKMCKMDAEQRTIRNYGWNITDIYQTNKELLARIPEDLKQ